MNNNQRKLAFIWYLMVTILGISVLGIGIADYHANGITFKNVYFGITALYITFAYINKIEKLFDHEG